MGFITGNTNEFIVYLTDAGRKTFINTNKIGGLGNEIAYFALSDSDSNYNVLTDPSFDPGKTNQSIIGITNITGNTNGFKEVFTQINNHGNIIDGKNIPHALLGTNKIDLRNQIWYNPAPNVGLPKLATYKTTDPYRQYTLTGLNGIYPRTAYSSNVTLSDLIQNYDFYPIDNVDTNLFSYVNAALQAPINNTYFSFVGSNTKSFGSNNLLYSQITKRNELVIGENYQVQFTFYFRYFGAKNVTFNPTGTTPNLTISISTILGTNVVPMTISNLQQYSSTGSTYTNNILYRNVPTPGIGIGSVVFLTQQPLVYLSNTNTNINFEYSERTYEVTYNPTGYGPISGIFTINDHFEDYNEAPNGFNFKATASLDLTQFYSLNQCKNIKDFSILINYSKLSANYIQNNYITTYYTI
jgi:hypothetical protein